MECVELNELHLFTVRSGAAKTVAIVPTDVADRAFLSEQGPKKQQKRHIKLVDPTFFVVFVVCVARERHDLRRRLVKLRNFSPRRCEPKDVRSHFSLCLLLIIVFVQST